MPLNGEFQRIGYRYRSSLRNIKTAGTKILLALFAGVIFMIFSELRGKDEKMSTAKAKPKEKEKKKTSKKHKEKANKIEKE